MKKRKVVISRIVIGQGTSMNHRERRTAAKKLVGEAICERHDHALKLRGTHLVCEKCCVENRKEKQRQQLKKTGALDSLIKRMPVGK